MDGFINAKIEKQTIYEIYRACRLCGAGAGYKMPIIQNVVDLDGAEVELKQKIRDCVQIEVHQDDKMPPLICELCIDKVNDFYEFLEMCRQTNKRTRLRLGLPPQTLPRGAPDAGDCILGVTEPIFVNEDSNEPLSNSKSKSVRNAKSKKEDGKSKKTNIPIKKEPKELKYLRSKQPSPPRLRGKRNSDENQTLGKLQKTRKTDSPKSILKKEKPDEPLLMERKRTRGQENLKYSDNKRVKISDCPARSTRPKVFRPPPKSPSPSPSPSPPPPPLQYKCKTCKVAFASSKSLNNHMRSHNTKVPEKKSSPIAPKIECKTCHRRFMSKGMLNIHYCMAKSVSEKCYKCGRLFTSRPQLVKHEGACKKKEARINPRLLAKCRPLRVRVSPCDKLLIEDGSGHYNVAAVSHEFGLDKNCYYPYIASVRIKTEPGYMVKIQDDFTKDFSLDEDFVHWDSDSDASETESTEEKKKCVETLSTLTLKTLFSQKLLGKVPKRRRRVKEVEKAFDSILNATTDFDSDIRLGIDNIIDSLDKDTSVLDNSVGDSNVNKSKDGDNDSLFGDEKAPAVTNDDFDSIFGNDKQKDGIDSSNTESRTTGEVLNESNESAIIETDKQNVVDEVNDKKLYVSEDRKDGDEKSSTQENDKLPKETELETATDPVEEIKSVDKMSDHGELDGNDKSDVNSVESTDKKLEEVISTEDSNLLKDTQPEVERKDEVPENNIESTKTNETNDSEFAESHVKDSLDESTRERDENIESNKTESEKNTNDSQENPTTNENIESAAEETKKIGVDNKELDIKSDREEIEITIGENKQSSINTENNNESKKNNTDEAAQSTKDTEDKKKNGEIEKNGASEEKAENISADEPCLNGNTEAEEKFSMDDLEDISDSEMDDSRLMEALDEHIGEGQNDKEKENAIQEKEKVTIEDLAPQHSVKSADLESISDEDFSID